MPDLDDETTADLEKRVEELPSLGVLFSDESAPKDLIMNNFSRYKPKFLAERRIEFMCHCNENRLRSIITLLPIDELKDICDKGPFPLEMRCQHCNTAYQFTRDDIRKIYGARYPQN
jgi:molecular chaperone Hsp33